MENRRRLDLIGVLAGVALLAVTVAVDLALDTTVVLIGFFSLAPLLTAAFAPPRPTAVLGAVTVLAAVGAGGPDNIFGTTDHVARCALVGVLSLLAVLIAAVRESRERELLEITTVADATQQAVLRPLPVSVGRLDIATSYTSANRAALVGGDFYELEETTFGVRILLGDVRGSGLPAVRLAALVLGVFRGLAHVQPDLTQLVRDLDATVVRDGNRRPGAEDLAAASEEFATALIVEIRDCRMTVVNAGHHPGLLVGPEGHRLLPESEAPPLGLGPRPAPEHYSFGPGQRLLLYTDGLVEARDRSGNFFPLLDHARSLERAGLDDGPAEGLDRLRDLVRQHVGHVPADDLALLLVEQNQAGS